MSPSAVLPEATAQQPSTKTQQSSAVLHRSLTSSPWQVASASGSRVTFSNGQTIIDSTCGAGVSCIGYSDPRVQAAMVAQIEQFCYTNSMFFGTAIGEALARELVDGTGGKMARALIVSSGSEAMEAAMKMARQYFVEIGQAKRLNFVAREGSYHGTTLGALAMSGHKARRGLFEGMLLENIGRVSRCDGYRGRKEGETDEIYVDRLAKELDEKFQEMGPETVCAFVAEPVVGATLGCVPAVPGYFQAMKKVCDKYGALLILDEVMSGMGRVGTLHAWEQEGVVPDIQTIAKGLGGGFASIAGILINHKVEAALKSGSGAFSHGHTYQGHPVACAAALQVQKIIREDQLLKNVREVGAYFGQLLHDKLDSHPHVGNVRGKGLFWGIEFVADKASKKPFPRAAGIANAVHTTALNLKPYGISLYPGNGTMDGVDGDHVLLAPAYNITRAEAEEIVQLTREAIDKSFADTCPGCKNGQCK